MNALAPIDRILAGHGVADEKHLIGLHELVDLLQFVHRHLGDVQPAGRVENDRVEQPLLGEADRIAADRHRVGVRFAVDGNADLFAEHFQLFDGGGSLQVGGDEQRLCDLCPSASVRACRPWSSCLALAGRRASRPSADPWRTGCDDPPAP